MKTDTQPILITYIATHPTHPCTFQDQFEEEGEPAAIQHTNGKTGLSVTAQQRDSQEA